MRRKFYLDLFERVAWTFVEAFAAAWAVTAAVDETSFKVGLLAGALAVVKGFAAHTLGNPFSASTAPGV